MRSLPLVPDARHLTPDLARAPALAPVAVAETQERTPITERLIALKAKIFREGLHIPDALWPELTDENHYKHKRAGLSQGRFFRLTDGAASTAVNAPVLEPFAKRSRLRLAKKEGGYEIYEDDVMLCDAVPFAWPKWYSKTTSEGAPMSSVVSAHCDTSLYTAIYQAGCDYWHDDQMCAFCAMKVDQKAKWRKIESIIEVAKAALEENPRAEISFGGGTRLSEDKSAKHKAEAVAALKREVDMRVCVEIAAPDTDDWLDRLKDAGLDSILMNLELWSEDARARIMPGKAAISRERYLAALRHAVKILGHNQASSQIIIGLEPLADTLTAIRAILDTGAIPLPVVFRPLVGTRLADHPTPPLEDCVAVFLETFRMMRDAELSGQRAHSGCALCGACSAHR